MSRISVALALTITGVAATAVATPADAALRTFRSPTGKLGCMFYSDADVPRQVRVAGSRVTNGARTSKTPASGCGSSHCVYM